MLGEASEDEEIVEMSDKEKEEILRDITSISSEILLVRRTQCIPRFGVFYKN